MNVLEIRTAKSDFDREYDQRLKKAEKEGLDARIMLGRKNIAKQDYEDRYKRAKGTFLESKSGFVDFDLLQFKLPISTSLAPAVWSLVLLGFFSFALVQRRRAYAEIMAYVQTYRRRYDGKLLVPGAAADAGFTLAPLPPPPPSGSISASDVATVLAWRGDGARQRALLLAALFTVIAVVQLRVLLLALEFNSVLIQVTRVYPLPARVLAIVACFACASGTAFLAVRWWRMPITAEAPQEEAPQAGGGPLIGRRYVLGVVLPASAITVALLGDWLNNRHLRRLGIDPGSKTVRSLAGHAPRYRRREKLDPVEVGLPNGLALYPSSRTLTYIDDEGRLRAKSGRLAAQPVHQPLAQAIAWVEGAAPASGRLGGSKNMRLISSSAARSRMPAGCCSPGFA